MGALFLLHVVENVETCARDRSSPFRDLHTRTSSAASFASPSNDVTSLVQLSAALLPCHSLTARVARLPLSWRHLASGTPLKDKTVASAEGFCGKE